MKKMYRLAVAAVAVACAGMWGCSWDDFKWYDAYVGANVVGFVDDSLVIVGDYQSWLETHENILGQYSDVSGVGRERLCVYNYRVQEDGPRWCEQIDDKNTTGAFAGQMTDSIIWGKGLPDKLKMWKIGERQHEIKLSKSLEGCSTEFDVSSIHEWLDGSFIARGDKSLNADGKNCQYAVLDTVERTITYKRLDENLKWIQKCDDVKAVENKVYCLQTIIRTEQIGHLIVDNVDQGKLDINAAIGPFWGNMLELGNNLCKLSDGGFLECLQVRWLGGKEVNDAEFVDENGNSVYLRE